MCFFFNDTATTEIYTLSLHDALPIYPPRRREGVQQVAAVPLGHHARVGEHHHAAVARRADQPPEPLLQAERSEEHTSELQSRQYLVCRLLLEKKKSRSLSSRIRVTHT